MKAVVTAPLLWTFAVKGVNVAGSFAITVMLARIAGAEAVGQYALAFHTAALTSLLPLRGLNVVALRTISGDMRVGRLGEARGTARWLLQSSVRAVLLASLLFALAVAFGPVADRLEADQRALLAAAVGVLSFPLFLLGIYSIRALGKPVWGQFVEGLPSVMLATILLSMAISGWVPPIWLVVLIMFSGQLLSAGMAFLLFRHVVRAWPARVAPDPSVVRALKAAGLPMMGVALLHSFSDWFLLAATTGFAGAAETGAFRATMQLMLTISVILVTAETYVAPRLGGDLRAGLVGLAWRRHVRATALITALSSPLLLLFFANPQWVLITLFGGEFASAASSLRIMAIGQLLNVLTGPAGVMLLMSGRERLQFLTTLGAAGAMILLGLLLIPRLGLDGAAIAYATSLALRNIGMFTLARILVRPGATSRQ